MARLSPEKGIPYLEREQEKEKLKAPTDRSAGILPAGSGPDSWR